MLRHDAEGRSISVRRLCGDGEIPVVASGHRCFRMATRRVATAAWISVSPYATGGSRGFTGTPPLWRLFREVVGFELEKIPER